MLLAAVKCIVGQPCALQDLRNLPAFAFPGGACKSRSGQLTLWMLIFNFFFFKHAVADMLTQQCCLCWILVVDTITCMWFKGKKKKKKTKICATACGWLPAPGSREGFAASTCPNSDIIHFPFASDTALFVSVKKKKSIAFALLLQLWLRATGPVCWKYVLDMNLAAMSSRWF